MYISMYVCTCASCMYLRMYVLKYACVHAPLYVISNNFKCMQLYAACKPCLCINMCLNMCLHIHSQACAFLGVWYPYTQDAERDVECGQLGLPLLLGCVIFPVS